MRISFLLLYSLNKFKNVPVEKLFRSKRREEKNGHKKRSEQNKKIKYKFDICYYHNRTTLCTHIMLNFTSLKNK